MDRNLLSFLFLLCYINIANSQSDKELLHALFFEKVARENSILINGIEPVDSKIILNKSGKFLFNQFDIGNINYNKHYFNNILIKYNVYDDIVLSKIPHKKGQQTFQLITKRLSKFSIRNKNFIWLKSDHKNFGYVEVILDAESILLYKKYKKIEFEKRDKNYVYYEYKFHDSEFYVEYQDAINIIKNKQDLIQIWPTKKKLIRNYYKQNKELKDKDKFYSQILVLIKNSVN